MTDQQQDSVLFPLAGAGVGTTISQTVGGMGLVGSFGGMGIGLVPMTAAGGIVGMATYGVCEAIAQQDVTAVAAIGLGGLGGAMVYSSIGGMGLSIGGTAFSIGMGSMAMAGGIFGLGIYGLAKMIDLGRVKEPTDLNQILVEYNWKLLDVEDELQALKAEINQKKKPHSVKIESPKSPVKLAVKNSDILTSIASEYNWRLLDVEDELQALKAQIFGQS